MTVKLWRDERSKDLYMIGTETPRGSLIAYQSLNGEALESLYGKDVSEAAFYMPRGDMLEVELSAQVKAPY